MDSKSPNMAVKEWIEVTERHIKDFGEANFGRYFECHYLKDGKIVKKCRESWNCDCKDVGFHKEQND